MKILCFIDSLGSGGAQRQLTQLAIGFKNKGHNVEFLVYYKEDFYKNVLDENNIKIHEIIENKILSRIFKIRKFIRTNKYDAVIVFLETPSFIATISGFPFRKWKLIVGERNANPHILSSVKLRFYRLFHSFADHVVANSKANLRMVYKLNPLIKSKGSVINNIVDTEKFSINKEYEFRKEGNLLIVVAASFVYRKNLIGLVEALKLMNRDELEGINIHWYGNSCEIPFFDNSLPEGLREIKMHSLNRNLKIVKSITDIQEKMKEADAIALFSHYEGQPNTILEGMSCGKPVLCSKVADINEIIRNPFFIFNSKKPEQIKNAILKLKSLPVEKLAEIGKFNRKIIEKSFSEEKILNAYLKLITKT